MRIYERDDLGGAVDSSSASCCCCYTVSQIHCSVVVHSENGLGDAFDISCNDALVGCELADETDKLGDSNRGSLGRLVDVPMELGGLGIASTLFDSVKKLLGTFCNVLGLVKELNLNQNKRGIFR